MVTIKGIKIADLGFYINLDRRTDRKEILEKQLEDFGIQGVQRLSAFYEYDANTLNCKRSHLQVMEKLLDSNYESVLILEDDCKFLEILKENYESIFEDINKTNWDLFWLGCRNRRGVREVENNCFQVSSVSYAQSYVIKRNFSKFIIDNFSEINFFGQPSTPDELLCLAPYGVDVVCHPDKYDFYKLDQPLDVIPTQFRALCYKNSLSTQYPSYSDLWYTEVDYEQYICGTSPKQD